jgi:PLP dependent protein
MPQGEWHLIGHLQTNKVRMAVRGFTLIESVDSLRLAHKLDREAELALRKLPILLEVNVAGEETKSGFDPERLRASIPELKQLSHLELRGLMTVAPLSADAEDTRWVFRRLRELRDAIRDRFDLSVLSELSMGMSNDFRVAIEEGATMIRIGRAIFGERPAR